jgi:hypothetical protein
MATESGTGTGPVEPTTTTTTEAEVTTTTTTEAPTTTTTTVDSTEEDKAFYDAIDAAHKTEVTEPADDHILGDNETTHGELLANARAEALANHEAEHAE